MKKLLILALCVVLLSCESNRVFEENTDLEDLVWLVNDVKTFQFEIADAAKTYNLYYNIRNTLDYPYARLFVEYTLADSSGAVLTKKLVSEYLFDQKTGKPLGEGGIGDVFDHQFKILDKQVFPYAGKYQLLLKQFNRADTLKGIVSVGARVEHSQTN